MKRFIVVFIIVITAILFATILRGFIVDYLFTVKFLEDIAPLYRYVVSIVGILIWFSILYKSDNAYEKIPWLLFIILIPEFAILCYLSFGYSFKASRRFKKRPLMHGKAYINYRPVNSFKEFGFTEIDDEVNEIFKFSHNVSGHSVYGNNSSTRILNNGIETFEVMKEKLLEAKNFIFMEYFVLRNDELGMEIMEILRTKSLEGVEVILLYDFFGGHLSARERSYLRKAGVKIVRFEKLYFPLFNTRINYRLHRKITVVDGKYGFTGGLNLGDEYVHRNKKYKFWRDTHLLVEGPAVAGLTTIFLKDYYFQTGKMITDEKYFDTEPLNVKGYVQNIESGPDSDVPIISQTYIKMINQAKHSVKIVTPYISPSKELALAIKVAALSGISVDIIIPGQPDKIFVYAITKSFLNSILSSGVKVHIYKDNFVHSKILIIDDKIASVGSFNLNNRSETINFENTCIFSNDSVKVLSNYFEEDLKKCREYRLEDYQKEGKFKKFIYTVLNLLSPLA